MIESKSLHISVVIPVYNEEEQLAACLRALAAQKQPLYEVIVVDNNSIDNTLAVARQFSGVKVIAEARQGVIHARTTGFNAARGDIIARIDGDTVVPTEWVETIQAIFSDHTIQAVSGAPHYYDFAFSAMADGIDGYLRRNLANKLRDNNFLYGANMALRRSAWLEVRTHLCSKAGLHEDFDLAIHLQQLGMKVTYNSQLIAGVSSRRIDTSFGKYVRYTLKSPQTYAKHGLTKSRRHMYPVLLVCWLCYAPGRLLYRAYDADSETLSLARLLDTPTLSRVDPTAHVAD